MTRAWVDDAAAVAAGTDAVDAALGRCLAQARREGWRLHLEVDEADRWLWRLAPRLAARWEDDWLNFHGPASDAVSGAVRQ